jgi:hypothetical protein
MQHLNRRIGCGMWLVGLIVALFAAEWLVLWVAVRLVSVEQLPLMVIIVAITTIVVGTLTIYFRVQRRIK